MFPVQTSFRIIGIDEIFLDLNHKKTAPFLAGRHKGLNCTQLHVLMPRLV